MRKPISEWPEDTGFVCNICGNFARINPDNNHEWGCARCNGASFSVSLCFTRVNEFGQSIEAERPQ